MANNTRRLSWDQYCEVLTSPESNEDAARRLRLVTQSIQKIRSGNMYTDWYRRWIKENGGEPHRRKNGPMTFEWYQQIVNDPRPAKEVAAEHGTAVRAVMDLRAGKTYSRYRQWLTGGREESEQPVTEIHWSITTPWGRAHTPSVPAGYYGEVA